VGSRTPRRPCGARWDRGRGRGYEIVKWGLWNSMEYLIYGNAPHQTSGGGKNRTPSQPPTNLHLMFGWRSQHTRHELATCSPRARNIAWNMYTMSGEEGGGATWKKCSQHGKSSSEHEKKCSQHDVWMLVATCSPQARNMFATNS
jgi:hypothetical protein